MRSKYITPGEVELAWHSFRFGATVSEREHGQMVLNAHRKQEAARRVSVPDDQRAAAAGD